jgi:hypothetical protein
LAQAASVGHHPAGRRHTSDYGHCADRSLGSRLALPPTFKILYRKARLRADIKLLAIVVTWDAGISVYRLSAYASKDFGLTNGRLNGADQVIHQSRELRITYCPRFVRWVANIGHELARAGVRPEGRPSVTQSVPFRGK